MSTNVLSELQFSEKAAKRAQWESFEFSVPTSGTVAVRNTSYGEDVADEHTHAVNVEDGVPVSCTCKADEFGSGACKHRVAVAINTPVLEAATVAATGKRAIADGGAIVEPVQEEIDEATHAAGCDNPECEGLDGDAERPVLSFECWEQWAAYDEEQLIEEAH